MIGNYGFRDDPSACEFNGDLDRIQIYNRALSQAEILASYTTPGVPAASARGLALVAASLALLGLGALRSRRLSGFARLE